MEKPLIKKLSAEALGTAVLVLIACGVAMLTRNDAGVVDVVTTALAFGLVIVAMAYAIGPISGCHINPAVSLAMAINKRITWLEFAGYAIAQTLGAIVGGGLLYAAGKILEVTNVLGDTYSPLGGLGANGYSEIGNKLAARVGAPNVDTWKQIVVALAVEVILTFIFVLTILAVTGKKSGAGKKAGLIIGLTLTLVHLFGINITGTSVNPARSIGPAIFAAFNDSAPLKEVWVFILAPLVGAALAAIVAKTLLGTEKE